MGRENFDPAGSMVAYCSLHVSVAYPSFDALAPTVPERGMMALLC